MRSAGQQMVLLARAQRRPALYGGRLQATAALSSPASAPLPVNRSPHSPGSHPTGPPSQPRPAGACALCQRRRLPARPVAHHQGEGRLCCRGGLALGLQLQPFPCVACGTSLQIPLLIGQRCICPTARAMPLMLCSLVTTWVLLFHTVAGTPRRPELRLLPVAGLP